MAWVLHPGRGEASGEKRFAIHHTDPWPDTTDATRQPYPATPDLRSHSNELPTEGEYLVVRGPTRGGRRTCPVNSRVAKRFLE